VDALGCLEDGEKTLREAVKVRPRLLLVRVIVELASKDLHPQQGKDHDEEEEEEKK